MEKLDPDDMFKKYLKHEKFIHQGESVTIVEVRNYVSPKKDADGLIPVTAKFILSNGEIITITKALPLA